VDTRTKILTPALAAALDPARPLLLVTGHFDILRAELVRELSEARRRAGAQTLIAVVQPMAGELAPVASRAEMAAALRVVDYVLIAGNEDLNNLAASLQPIEIVRLEEADARRTRQLIEHVQRRQS
jgi:bifunctional ADP-heptose synthase (sugar kinase/adenylyltransferase)